MLDVVSHKHGLVHVPQIDVEGFGEQQFDVMFRSVDTRRAQYGRGGTHRFEYRSHNHALLLVGETIGLIRLDVGIDDGLQIAVKHGVKIVRLVVRTMIDDTVLREVVRADSFGTIQ